MAPTVGRPLSNDAEPAGEPARAQASPQLGTVAAAGRPLGVEPGQLSFQAAPAHPEHVPVRPRSTSRTSLRLWPVVRTICLIDLPCRDTVRIASAVAVRRR
jgi:hypothetical protein